jgi:hypothetical protein
MGSQMSHCWSEAWSSVCFTSHFRLISEGSCGTLELSRNYIWNLDPYIWSRDQRIIQEKETQWFPASKVVQDTEFIKQCVGVCLPGQRWNFSCRLPGKWCNHHDKVLCCTYRQTYAATDLQASRQVSKGILFLQDNAAPHKEDIT